MDSAIGFHIEVCNAKDLLWQRTRADGARVAIQLDKGTVKVLNPRLDVDDPYCLESRGLLDVSACMEGRASTMSGPTFVLFNNEFQGPETCFAMQTQSLSLPSFQSLQVLDCRESESNGFLPPSDECLTNLLDSVMSLKGLTRLSLPTTTAGSVMLLEGLTCLKYLNAAESQVPHAFTNIHVVTHTHTKTLWINLADQRLCNKSDGWPAVADPLGPSRV